VAKPEKVLIPYVADEHSRFHHVGRCGPAEQFMAFVTGAFPADWWSGKYQPEYLSSRWKEHKRWCAVLHRFDSDGNHVSTVARSGGTTALGAREASDRAVGLLAEMLASLGESYPCDIQVKPFGVEIDGYFYGLRYCREDADDPDDPGAASESVLLEPNGIMFHPPWDSGEYST
jgi:hypothetical protein